LVCNEFCYQIQCKYWARELWWNLTGVGFICDLSEGKCQCYEMFNQLYVNECAKNSLLLNCWDFQSMRMIV
jgi:hypothetical protein